MVVDDVAEKQMTDEELIAEGRKLVGTLERAQLELGRLALQFAPIGEPSVKTGVYDRVDRYAEEVGVDTPSMRNYRTVAHGWQGIDTGGFGFSVLKACLSIGDKEGFLEALREHTPRTRSGRWTVAAAVEFAHANGYWSHRSARRDSIEAMISTVKRTRHTIARLPEYEWSGHQLDALMSELTQLALEITTVREHIRESVPGRR